MKTNILTLITIATAILLTSCEKEIEFNGEQSDPKLVVNSLVEPDQRVKAYISKSYFFLDTPNTTAPDDLVASLYVNGNLVGEMIPFMDTVWGMWEDDYYCFPAYYNDYRAQDGDIIQITATANGFDEVEGSTSPLPQVADCQMDVEVICWSGWYQHAYNFDTQEYEEDSIWDVLGQLELTFTITDPNPGKTDYFRLIANGGKGHYGMNWYYIGFDYDDPIFGASVSENELIDISDLDTRPEGVFTDLLFDGGTYRLKVMVSFECTVAEEFDPDFFTVPFMLEHLSKEYYNYINTCDQGDVALQIWAEPIQTYSNVTNGFGIVAGKAVNTKRLELPIEEP